MTPRDQIASIKAALGLLHVRIILAFLALLIISAAGMALAKFH